MTRWAIGSSLRAPRVMVAVAAGLLLVGIWRLRDMPRDVLPEFTPPTVEVQTEALGLSAEEVEQLITVPLEQDLLNGVAFLDRIRSASVAGLSSIQMVFEPGTDLLKARQVVQERLSQAQVALPGVQSRPPQMLQPLSSTSRVMLIGLSSRELSTIDMSILARWTITPRLLGVPGVANVAVWGNRDRQLQVLVDPARLRDRGLSLHQIIETTANAQFVSPLTFTEASTPGTGGILETPNQRLGIQHRPVFATAADLASVPIEDAGRSRLTLGDVAEVVEDHQPLIGDSIGRGLLLVIEKFPAANTAEVTRGVEEALDALRPGLSGVAIDSSIYRAATYVEQANGNLFKALLVGVLLAVLLLGVLAFEWRTTVVAVLAVAASLAVAVLVLSLTQATLNSMVLAGLTLGLVAVVVEAILDASNAGGRLDRDPPISGNGPPATTVLLEATVQMRGAASYAALIVAAALVPTLFTKGAVGAFFPSIAVAYVVAILASMAVALVMTPALGVLLASKSSRDGGSSPVFRWVRPRYERVLSRLIGSPLPAYAMGSLVVLAGVVAFPFLGRSMVPSFKDPSVLVELTGAPGTSLQEMNRITARIAEDLRAIPGIEDVGAHAGRAVLSDQVVGSNASEVWVSIGPGADYDATVGSIEQVVHGYPGLDRRVMTYPRQRIEEVLSDPVDPIQVRLYGPDVDVLRTQAEEVRRVLAKVDGIADPVVNLSPHEPTLEIEVDLSSAERYGIKPGDVRRAATTLLSGIRVGSLFEEQKVFEVVVWGTPGVRGDVSTIRELLIDTPTGRQVRLGDVADVRIAPAPVVIRHDAVSRYVDVTAGVSGRSLGDVTADARSAVSTLRFPLEYHAQVLGDFAERRAADLRLLVLGVIAAIGIFLLLQAALASWRLSALAFLILPLALLGGVLGAWAGGGVVSVGSLAGFFGVLWVAARQTIYSIKRYPTRSVEDGERLDRTLVVRSAGECLAPILTSTIVAIAALAPAVIAGEIAGLELVRPMALVVIGGTVVATVLNLFVLPALYPRFAPRAEAAVPLSLVEAVIDLTKQERHVELVGGQQVELVGGKDEDAAP